MIFDLHKLAADLLEAVKNLHTPVHGLPVASHLPRRPFEGQALLLDKQVNLFQTVQILRREQPVAFGVSLRLDVLWKRIGPEPHQRRALAQYVSGLTDGIIQLFH